MKSALYDVAMYTHRHSWKGSQREREREREGRVGEDTGREEGIL